MPMLQIEENTRRLFDKSKKRIEKKMGIKKLNIDDSENMILKEWNDYMDIEEQEKAEA